MSNQVSNLKRKKKRLEWNVVNSFLFYWIFGTIEAKAFIFQNGIETTKTTLFDKKNRKRKENERKARKTNPSSLPLNPCISLIYDTTYDSKIPKSGYTQHKYCTCFISVRTLYWLLFEKHVHIYIIKIAHFFLLFCCCCCSYF